MGIAVGALLRSSAEAQITADEVSARIRSHIHSSAALQGSTQQTSDSEDLESSDAGFSPLFTTYSVNDDVCATFDSISTSMTHMKTLPVLIFLISAAGVTTLSAQGYMYDQQSATESSSGGLSIAIQSNQPLGQSFTPSLNGVGFIRLSMGDTAINGTGARVHVNLIANSITGTVLASSAPVTMSDGYVGYTDFVFPSTVPVVPGVKYYFQPIVETGDLWTTTIYNWLYSGGTAIVKGTPDQFDNLWFREGVIVPEPSTIALLVFGTGVLLYPRRRRNQTGNSSVSERNCNLLWIDADEN
jgi:hypothetical protein